MQLITVPIDCNNSGRLAQRSAVTKSEVANSSSQNDQVSFFQSITPVVSHLDGRFPAQEASGHAAQVAWHAQGLEGLSQILNAVGRQHCLAANYKHWFFAL